MNCEACKLQKENLMCRACISERVGPLKEHLFMLIPHVKLLREKTSLAILRQSSDQMVKEIHRNTLKRLKEKFDKKNLEKIKTSIESLKNQLEEKRSFIKNFIIEEETKEKCENLMLETEKKRKIYIKEAADIFENNAYFPDYCISELFQLERCIGFSQIFQDEGEMKSIDKTNFIISFKSNQYSAIMTPFMTDEHLQSIIHSINSICFFINFSSFILNMDMPFPLSFSKSYFTIEDHSGNIHHLDANDTFACETALIYLYQNLRYMQQHAGVDLNLLKGVFDVKSFANSPFLGRWFSIPSLPINKVLPVKQELKIESQSESESEDEWEVLS